MCSPLENEYLDRLLKTITAVPTLHNPKIYCGEFPCQGHYYLGTTVEKPCTVRIQTDLLGLSVCNQLPSPVLYK